MTHSFHILFLISHSLMSVGLSVVVVLRTQYGTEGRTHNDFFICGKMVCMLMNVNVFNFFIKKICLQGIFEFVNYLCIQKCKSRKNREAISHSKQTHSFIHSFVHSIIQIHLS